MAAPGRRDVPAVIGVGEHVPELALVDDRGEGWRLDAHRGEPLLLIFHRHFY